MTHAIELWDSKSANLLGSYDTVSAAIQHLTVLISEGDGLGWIARLVLTFEDDQTDEPVILARGREILVLSTVSPMAGLNPGSIHAPIAFGVSSSVGRQPGKSRELKPFSNESTGGDLHQEARGNVRRLAVAS